MMLSRTVRIVAGRDGSAKTTRQFHGTRVILAVVVMGEPGPLVPVTLYRVLGNDHQPITHFPMGLYLLISLCPLFVEAEMKQKIGIEKRVSRQDMAIIRLDALREVKAMLERQIRAIKTKHKI